MYRDRQRPVLAYVQWIDPRFMGEWMAYQKLFRLYLLATRRMAMDESPSVGYTPVAAAG